jgi:hypothetical protein
MDGDGLSGGLTESRRNGHRDRRHTAHLVSIQSMTCQAAGRSLFAISNALARTHDARFTGTVVANA